MWQCLLNWFDNVWLLLFHLCENSLGSMTFIASEQKMITSRKSLMHTVPQKYPVQCTGCFCGRIKPYLNEYNEVAASRLYLKKNAALVVSPNGILFCISFTTPSFLGTWPLGSEQPIGPQVVVSFLKIFDHFFWPEKDVEYVFNQFDSRKAPEVRGMLFTRGWGKVQLGPDTWDWDAFDKQVEQPGICQSCYFLS